MNTALLIVNSFFLRVNLTYWLGTGAKLNLLSAAFSVMAITSVVLT